MTLLTERFHLSERVHEACDRLTTLVQTHARRLLETEYWDDDHLEAITDHPGQSYTYIRDDDYDAFETVQEYVYSRFKRCVYHRVTHVLDAHTDEFHAFHFVLDTVAERKIRRIGWRRLRTRLFDDDSPYVEWRVLESVVDQLNEYYDAHGQFPDTYTELVETPEPNGTLHYAPDKGDYHIHEVSIEDGAVVVVLNAPDTLSPDSHHDWTDHEIRVPVHPRFNEMVERGDVKSDAEGVNDRLAELRRQGKAHTDRFDHLLGEYRQTRRKERRLREQIQHDVANQLVWLAMEYRCETIVFESLGQIDALDTSGAVAWSISSWARGDLLGLVDYKAELVGIDIKTVNPWGTSRHCPRCGERGRTVNAPDDHTEQRHGGHFHCPGCGYECDRDVVGAVNVGRKHLSASRMEGANPAAYTEAGKHASFPSLRDARSAGVQSTTDEQDTASGRQTRLPRFRAAPLTVKRGEADTGGLAQTHGSNTGRRSPSGSITKHVLASTPDRG